MLHVWIVANPCGPFAPREGIEAGEPAAGTDLALRHCARLALTSTRCLPDQFVTN